MGGQLGGLGLLRGPRGLTGPGGGTGPTGPAGSAAAKVADLTALRAITPEPADGASFLVQGDPIPWVYDRNSGAGFERDGKTIERINSVLLASNGRLYRATAAPVVATWAALGLCVSGNYETIHLQAYTTKGDGAGGIFDYDSSDTTSADDGGTIRVAGTRRYKRRFAGAVELPWFGCVNDNATNNYDGTSATPLGRVKAYLEAHGGAAHVPTGLGFKHINSTGWLLTPAAGKPIRIFGDGPSSKLVCGGTQQGFGGSGATDLTFENLQVTGSASRPVCFTGDSTNCKLNNLTVNGATVFPTSGPAAGIYIQHAVGVEINSPIVTGCDLTPLPTNFTYDFTAKTWHATAHGFTNGTQVELGTVIGTSTAGTLPTGTGGGAANYALDTVYYVRDSTADTLKLSASLGGPVVNADVSNGTGTIRIELATPCYGIAIFPNVSGNLAQIRNAKVTNCGTIQIAFFDPILGSYVSGTVDGGGAGKGGGFHDGYGILGYTFNSGAEIEIGPSVVTNCAGPGVYTAALARSKGSNVQIENCNLFKADATLPGGGWASNSDGASLSNIVVRNSGASSFSIIGSKNTMKGCISYSPSQHGLYLRSIGDGNDLEITSIDSGSNAINEDGGASNGHLRHSKIKAVVVGYGVGGADAGVVINNATGVDFDLQIQQTTVQGGLGVIVLAGSGNTFNGRVSAAQGKGWDIRCTGSRHYGHADSCTGVGIDVSAANNAFINNELVGNSSPFTVDAAVVANTKRIGTKIAAADRALIVAADGIGTASTNAEVGVSVQNSKTSTTGNQQNSPMIQLSGHGNDGSGNDHLLDWFWQLRPLEHATMPRTIVHGLARQNGDDGLTTTSIAFGKSPDTGYDAIWLGLGTSLPTGGNYLVETAGTDRFWNAPTGGVHQWTINGSTTVMRLSATQWGLFGTLVTPPSYTVNNVSDLRTLDGSTATLADVINVLGTAIRDLKGPKVFL